MRADNAHAWYAARIVEDIDGILTAVEAFQDYWDWAEGKTGYRLNQHMLGKFLGKKAHRMKNSDGRIEYRGIRLIRPAEVPVPE